MPTVASAENGVHVFAGNRYIGEARVSGDKISFEFAHDSATADLLANARVYAVIGRKEFISGPFGHVRGKMWEHPASELNHMSDNEETPRRSNVFVLENDTQLPIPHSFHDDIDKYGDGRFSHWNSMVFFSSSDGSDPNAGDKKYDAFIGHWAGDVD